MLKSCLACAAIMLCSVPAFAATLCVNPNGTGGCEKTIQNAVSKATPGDTINVDGILDAHGTYGVIKAVHRWTSSEPAVRPAAVPRRPPAA